MGVEAPARRDWPVLCLIFLLLAAPSPAPQTDGTNARPIEWTTERKLRWQDFAMKALVRSSDDSHSWVGFETVWTCDRRNFVFHVTTTFDPSQSWVKPGSQNDVLLRHEQTHFDLTEVAARQLRKRLADLNDPCRSFVMGEIDRLIADQRQPWKQAQELYDRETGHGTNEMRQRFWDERTQTLLDELKGFE